MRKNKPQFKKGDKVEVIYSGHNGNFATKGVIAEAINTEELGRYVIATNEARLNGGYHGCGVMDGYGYMWGTHYNNITDKYNEGIKSIKLLEPETADKFNEVGFNHASDKELTAILDL